MRRMLVYEAVVFDLFGTLTQTMSWANEERAAADMADALGLPREVFHQAWVATNVARDLGVYANCAATLAHVCTTLGAVATPVQMAQACAIRFAALREALTPRDDALETLYGLRQQGLRAGCLSDASFDVVALWPETPFAQCLDVVLFSCREGVKKPAPQLYHRACEQLQVPSPVASTLAMAAAMNSRGPLEWGCQRCSFTQAMLSTGRYTDLEGSRGVAQPLRDYPSSCPS